jgi:sodium/pantothenate symporter
LSFICIDLAVKNGLLTLPKFLDPFILGMICSFIALIIGSYLTRPTKENLAYFEVIQKAKLSDLYIEPARNDPEKFAQLKEEYKSTYTVAVVTTIVAVVFFGGLGLMFALPLL